MIVVKTTYFILFYYGTQNSAFSMDAALSVWKNQVLFMEESSTIRGRIKY